MKIYMVHSNFTWFSHLKSTYFMSSHKINATTHLSSSMFVGQLKSNITLVCELSPSLLAYIWDFISINLLKSKNFFLQKRSNEMILCLNMLHSGMEGWFFTSETHFDYLNKRHCSPIFLLALPRNLEEKIISLLAFVVTIYSASVVERVATFLRNPTHYSSFKSIHISFSAFSVFDISGT